MTLYQTSWLCDATECIIMSISGFTWPVWIYVHLRCLRIIGNFLASGYNSDYAVGFINPDFLQQWEISAIGEHLGAVLGPISLRMSRIGIIYAFDPKSVIVVLSDIDFR